MNQDQASTSELLAFCKMAAEIPLESRIIEAMNEAARAQLQSAHVPKFKAMLFGILSDSTKTWIPSQPAPKPIYEILRNSMLNEGTLLPGFRRAAAYLELCATGSRGKEFFLQATILLLRSGIGLMIVLDLIGQDHPDPPFRKIAQEAAGLVKEGMGLNEFFAHHSAVLGNDFVKAWSRGEQLGTLTEELESLTRKSEGIG